MNIEIKDKFLSLWKKYFGDAELPIAMYFSNNVENIKTADVPKGWRCFIGDLSKVRAGASIAFSGESITCGGGKRYTGYSETIRPGFEYFLSCGNETIEGERYKKTPEIVTESLKYTKQLFPEDKKLICKRWDNLVETDEPEIVVFFAKPDVLSGLYTLSIYDRVNPYDGVIAPFAPGCGSIILYPFIEGETDNPRSVIGMFDVSARPYVESDKLSFSMPFKRLLQIMDYMEESFLITPSWDKVKKRINDKSE